MSSTTVSHSTTSPHAQPTDRRSLVRRFFGVVAQPQSYRNIAYLLLGLPLGTVWFTVLISGASVGVSMLGVALLGIPMLLGLWYLVRSFANVERSTANLLLGHDLALEPIASRDHGNLWVRLRSMTSDRDRWRELGYLMLRFPVGVATFTAAVTALSTPVMVAYAPFSVRYGEDHPFGDWSLSSTMEDVASSSPWSWFLVPLGLAMLIAAFHLLNALANACGRWTTAWLGCR
ncbi:MAG: sensor domain-containing protein [Acidimicrobiia bacterium]